MKKNKLNRVSLIIDINFDDFVKDVFDDDKFKNLFLASNFFWKYMIYLTYMTYRASIKHTHCPCPMHLPYMSALYVCLCPIDLPYTSYTCRSISIGRFYKILYVVYL